MNTFKLWLTAAILTFGCSMSVCAQTSMAGRVYNNPNIMADEFNKKIAGLDKSMDSIRNATIAEEEQKKGRKLNAEEMAKLDEQMKKANEILKLMPKAIITAITMDFKSEKDLEMRVHMEVDENVLKQAGIGWAKRKAMKVAMAIAPEKMKATYERKGDMLIVTDNKENDKDTLRIVSDGKYLEGKFDEKTPFRLTLQQ